MNKNNSDPILLLDSLPYIDEPYEDQEEKINQLIEEEMQTFDPPNYLEKFPDIPLHFSNSVFLETEYQRVRRGEKMMDLDTTRYQLDPPLTNKINDIQAWKQALQNAESQLEHQYLRLINLELLQTYGANAWKQYNDYLDRVHQRLQNLLEKEKQEIEKLNSQRKSEQNACGQTLRTLEAKWKHLIQKNLEIELACLELEKEIQQMKNNK